MHGVLKLSCCQLPVPTHAGGQPGCGAGLDKAAIGCNLKVALDKHLSHHVESSVRLGLGELSKVLSAACSNPRKGWALGMFCGVMSAAVNHTSHTRAGTDPTQGSGLMTLHRQPPQTLLGVQDEAGPTTALWRLQGLRKWA